MTLTPEWTEAIANYELAQRAGGAPSTTLATRRQHLQHLARRIGCGPFDVTADQLVAWAGEQAWQRSTRRGRRTTFQSFYRWAKSSKRIRRDPAKALPRVKPPAPKPRPCPEHAYLEALVRADDVETIWLELAADHGMRRSEIAVVRREDVFDDLVGYSIVVHGKGDKDRVLPMVPSTARKLLELEAGWAFPGDDNGHVSPRWLGKRVNRLLPDHWTIHSLLHRCANRTIKHADLVVTQDLLGHASPATTRMYVEADRTRMRHALLAAAGWSDLSEPATERESA